MGLVVALVIGTHILLWLIRLVDGGGIEKGKLTESARFFEVQDVDGFWLTLIALLASLSPIGLAFVEDTVFRHTLLVRPAIFWRVGTAGKALLVLLNAFLFGASHFFAFHGSLLSTVPYMVVGLFFSLVYLWRRNLWLVLVAHMVFNSAPFFASLLIVLLGG